MSQALRKLTAIVSKSKTCLIFINQIREKIGVMFGNPETTTGGRALKFYASMRVDIRRIQAIKEGDRVVGSRTRAKVVKNKVAAPFREAEFDILYGEGISREGDLLDLGVDKGVIEKSGTWLSYGGERMGQGRENARVFLKENKDIREKMEHALRKKLEIPGPGQNSTAPGPNGSANIAAEKPPMKAAAAAGGDRFESEASALNESVSSKRGAGGAGKGDPARFFFENVSGCDGAIVHKFVEKRGRGRMDRCLPFGWTIGQPFKTKHIETYQASLPIVTTQAKWIDYVSV